MFSFRFFNIHIKFSGLFEPPYVWFLYLCLYLYIAIVLPKYFGVVTDLEKVFWNKQINHKNNQIHSLLNKTSVLKLFK